MLVTSFSEAEGLCDRPDHQLWVGDRRQLDEGDAVCEEVARLARERDREGALAAAAGADDRHESDARAPDEIVQRPQVSFAADERGEQRWRIDLSAPGRG